MAVGNWVNMGIFNKIKSICNFPQHFLCRFKTLLFRLNRYTMYAPFTTNQSERDDCEKCIRTEDCLKHLIQTTSNEDLASEPLFKLDK